MTTDQVLEIIDIFLEKGCPELVGFVADSDCMRILNVVNRGLKNALKLVIHIPSESEWREYQYSGDPEMREEVRNLLGPDETWGMTHLSIYDLWHFNYDVYVQIDRYLPEKARRPLFTF